MENLNFKITGDSTRSVVINLLVLLLANQEELSHTMIAMLELELDKDKALALINTFEANVKKHASDILEAIYTEHGILEPDKIFTDE